MCYGNKHFMFFLIPGFGHVPSPMKCRGDEGSKPSFLDGDEVRHLDWVIYTNLYIQWCNFCIIKQNNPGNDIHTIFKAPVSTKNLPQPPLATSRHHFK